ncbi:MAG TPA: transcription antitermination factor NusB [Rhodospirillales bacterium]|nr:transcription antitermination factor NusB [Rhodospirillales bacterium]
MSRHPIPRRRAARLAAVQALYQVEAGAQDPEEVVREFRAHRLARLLEPFVPDLPSPRVDRAWFEHLVCGAWRRRQELDALIAEALAADWSLERCGYLLRACLRAGAFELVACPDVPTGVVIDEYIEIAKLFFSGDEPRFVNAVLDRIARRVRAKEETR